MLSCAEQEKGFITSGPDKDEPDEHGRCHQ